MNSSQISLNGVKLTSREHDLVACVICGRSNKKIARILGISPRTVETHIKNILHKLNVGSRADIIDLVEKSDHYLYFKQHYASLLQAANIADHKLDENIIIRKPSETRSRSLKIFFAANPLRHGLVSVFVIFVILIISMFLYFSEKDTPLIRSSLHIPNSSSLLERPDLLRKIYDSTSYANKGIRAVILTGLSGAGKTTLARAFALKQNYPVIWEVNARSEKLMEDSFEVLAYEVADNVEEVERIRNVAKLEMRRELLVSFVAKKLKEKGQWLLIFDNVVSPESLYDFIPNDPSVWGRGIIVLTTQNKTIENHPLFLQSQTISVGQLTPEEQLQLFDKAFPLQIPQDKKQILQFLESIPPYPLDTAIAAKYLEHTNISFQNYLESMDRPSEPFLTFQDVLADMIVAYPQSRFGISEATLDSIFAIHPDFQDLMNFIMYLDVDLIPYELLTLYSEPPLVDYFIYTLEKFSFLNKDNQQGLETFSIHKSLANICVNYLKDKYQPNSHQIEKMVRSITTYMRQARAKRDRQSLSYSVRNALSFLGKNLDLDPVFKGRILMNLGRIEAIQENYPAAEEYLTQASELFTKNLGTNSLKSLKALSKLVNVKRGLSRFSEALKDTKALRSLFSSKYGENHYRTLDVDVDMARIYCGMGDFKNAFDILSRTYKSKKVISEPQLWIRVRFSEVLVSSGFCREAEVMLRDYSPEKIKTPLLRSSYDLALAHTMIGQGKYEETIPLLKNVVSDKENFYQGHSPKLVESKLALANALIRSKDFQKAKSILTEIDQTNSTTGLNYPFLLQAFGDLNFSEGNLEEAHGIYLKTRDIFREKGHGQEYYSLEKLGDISYWEGEEAFKNGEGEAAERRFERALEYFSASSKILQEGYPQSSPHFHRLRSKIQKVQTLLKS